MELRVHDIFSCQSVGREGAEGGRERREGESGGRERAEGGEGGREVREGGR